MKGIVVPNRLLAIKAWMSMWARRIGTLISGTVVEIIETKTVWPLEWVSYYRTVKVWSVKKNLLTGKIYMEFVEEIPTEPPPPPTTERKLYRVLHNQERPLADRIDRNGLPEVYLLMVPKGTSGEFIPDETPVKATESIQRMMYDLFKHGTPDFDDAKRKKKFTVVYASNTAFMNISHGLDDNANFITGERLNAELPRFEKARVCGGATISGEVVGDMLKVETLRGAVPIDWLLARPWLYFEAVNSGKNISPFPQGVDEKNGIYGVCYIPLISAEDVYYPLRFLEEVSGIANPYEIKA